MNASKATNVVQVPSRELVDFASRLIAFQTDSQSENNNGFRAAAVACQDMIAAMLIDAGFEVDRFDTTSGHPTLVARLRGTGGGRTLILNGHVDVVPAGDAASWKHDPWGGLVVDGALHGRGAADMKAGVAASVFAARAFAKFPDRSAGDLVLHIVSDEEVAGTGSREALAMDARASAVISCEPTDLGIVTTHGGLMHLRIEIDGVAAHAGRRFAAIYPGHDGGGVNAIEKAFLIGRALQDLERQWSLKPAGAILPAGFNTISPGIILGGPGGGSEGRLATISNPGTTPDYCALEYNVWYLPWEQRADVVAEFETFVDHVSKTDDWLREHPPRLTWGFNGIDVPPADIPKDHPLTESLRTAIAEIGRQASFQSFTAASELGWYAERGIPGVLFGPGRITDAHSQDEHVSLSDIESCTLALIVAARRYCALADDV